MLFQPPMYHQNKGEGVCFLSRYFNFYLIVFSVPIVYVCILFICIYLRIHGLF